MTASGPFIPGAVPQKALFIVVSGLPASGKTTIGRMVAEQLAIPFIDKDEFLEAEFEKYDHIDPQLRQKLSRTSDEAMARSARTLGAGVLVSFWRPLHLEVSYGTSTQWVDDLTALIVELHCRCEPQIARQRFIRRKRHPGHNDNSRFNDLIDQFGNLAAQGPLGKWPVVTLDTGNLEDVAELARNAVEQILKLVSILDLSGCQSAVANPDKPMAPHEWMAKMACDR
jgi:thymidylate kinase